MYCHKQILMSDLFCAAQQKPIACAARLFANINKVLNHVRKRLVYIVHIDFSNFNQFRQINFI